MFSIALIIFIGSLCGIGVILFRKIPALRELPIEKENARAEYFSDTEKEGKQTNLSRFVCFEKFLKKFLLHIKILSLKIENFARDLSDKTRARRELKNDFLDDKEGDNIEENDIEEIKVELKEKLKKEPKPEIEKAIEKDDYWEKLKKFRKKKITRRRTTKKKKISKKD